MNDDLISRKAAINEVKKLHDVAWANWKETRISANTMIYALKDLPSAQPKQKKGRWIVIVKGCKLTSYKCSECGRYIADDTGYDVKKDYPFCHCGADMRGEQNEKND